MGDLSVRNWRELIKPKSIALAEDSHTESFGKFVCEPLERGFGITIGNAMRRILLSSIQGAAIVSVEFDDVVHEFSTIPGVIEDITDIILNLKELKNRIVTPIKSKTKASCQSSAKLIPFKIIPRMIVKKYLSGIR